MVPFILKGSVPLMTRAGIDSPLWCWGGERWRDMVNKISQNGAKEPKPEEDFFFFQILPQNVKFVSKMHKIINK